MKKLFDIDAEGLPSWKAAKFVDPPPLTRVRFFELLHQTYSDDPYWVEKRQREALQFNYPDPPSEAKTQIERMRDRRKQKKERRAQRKKAQER